MPMMGRGSDTRMYAPRSESETMYSSANEDGTKYSGNTPEEKEKKEENRKLRAEERKQRRDKIKHIKIRSSQGLKGEESPVPEDDSNKQDDEREISLQGGPAGSRGNLLDLATGAKTGTGSAMTGPLPIAMSEPMEGAWSTLLKGKIRKGTEDWHHEAANKLRHISHSRGEPMSYEESYEELDKMHRDILEQLGHSEEVIQNQLNSQGFLDDNRDYDLWEEVMYPLKEDIHSVYQDMHESGELLPFDDNWQNKLASKPMEGAWSSLLKAVLGDQRGVVFNPRFRTSESPNQRDVREGQAQGMVGSRRAAGVPAQTRARQMTMGQKRLDAGIDKRLMYSDPDYYDYLVARTQLPPSKQQELPYPAVERRNIERLGGGQMQGGRRGSIAQRAGFDASPAQLHNLQRLSTTMIPQKFMMRNDAIDYSDLTPSPVPNMVYTSDGTLIPDPRLEQKSSDFVLVSDILKRETPKSIESRRRREKRQQFRPSTGQFKRPPGGMNPVGATMRRFRARMRGIKGGKKTGLMKPHLSVEMSHRGIATKQPMSKDPQKYRQYMGQSEARKILGNVRSTFSPHARYGERSVTAGPTGAGRLGGLMPGQSGQMRQPSLKQIGVRRPRLRRPRNPVMAPAPPMGVPSPPMQAPSSISSLPQASTPMMMSEERAESDLLKGRRVNSLKFHKINLLRRLIAAQERAERMRKSMQGTRSAMENGHVPSHPAGVRAKDEEDPEGPTENLETDAKRFGLDPAGYLTSKRGHMG